MKIKLLGLLAIGGAIAYANKKRGGDFTLASFKDTLSNLGSMARDKMQSLTDMGPNAQVADSDADDRGDRQDAQYSSGFGGNDTRRSVRH